MSQIQRIALITGGGKGLGAAIAARLASRGLRVAVLGRDGAAIHAIAHEVDGLALEADVTDAEAMTHALGRLRATWGEPLIVVQNAGIAESAPLASTTDAIWDRHMLVNVTAPFRLARAVVPAMIAARFGRIVNIASNAGLTGYAYTSAYCASKHALVGLTRALAIELARTQVTVNAICPGFLDTDMTARAAAEISAKTCRSPEASRKALEELNPQKRLISVSEVSHVVAMLCDDAALAVNGQALAIDGGQVMR
jgi:3-hydroxybutyrate dehydrogenase